MSALTLLILTELNFGPLWISQTQEIKIASSQQKLNILKTPTPTSGNFKLVPQKSKSKTKTITNRNSSLTKDDPQYCGSSLAGYVQSPFICSFSIPFAVIYCGVYIEVPDMATRLPSPLGVLLFNVQPQIDFGPMMAQFSSVRYILAYSSAYGTIPIEIKKQTPLTYLVLYHQDGLEGTLPSEIGILSSLIYCYVGVNGLSGSIPSQFGELTHLTNLNLGENSFRGSIPSQLGKLQDVSQIDFSLNQFSGRFPSEIGLLTLLSELKVERNYFEGQLPSELGSLTLLNILNFKSCLLSGSIPSEVSNIHRLTYLDFTGNQLNGALPSELGILTDLESINLSNNRLQGTLPSQFGKLKKLEYLYIDKNLLSGFIPTELGSLDNIIIIDFSNNQISGSIPTELGKLKNIKTIDFSNNKLFGMIPSELGLLTSLLNLYLEQNELTGTLPNQLSVLSVITNFNISYNLLTGTISSDFFKSNKSISCDFSGLTDSNCKIKEASIITYLDLPTFIIISVLIILLLIFILITLILTYKHRRNKIIKATNYRMGIFAMVGLFILALSVIFLGLTLIETDNYALKDSACIIFPHLIIHGLVTVLSCIIARNYPVWKVFLNPKLKQVAIRPYQLYRFVVLVLLVSIGLVIPATVDTRGDHSSYGCVGFSLSSQVISALIVFIIILAFVAGWMCFKIRNVTERFNNTKDVANATFNLLTFGVAMGFIALIAGNPKTLFVAIFFCVFVGTGIFTGLVYAKKLKEAIRESDRLSQQEANNSGPKNPVFFVAGLPNPK